MNLLGKSLEVLQQNGYQFALLLKHRSTVRQDPCIFDELLISNNLNDVLIEQVNKLAFKLRSVSSDMHMRDNSSVLVSSNRLQFQAHHHPCNNDINKYRHNTFQTTERLPTVDLNIADFVAIEKYFNVAFRLLRQLPCKQISKCWIKVIEPKKKARFPYTLGEKSKPSWWPQKVQHREPDHLQKPDRVALMIAIMLYVAPMWYQKNREIYKDMRDATHTLFKNDREGFLKSVILENAYKVSQAIAETRKRRPFMLNVLDLSKIKSTKQYCEFIKNLEQKLEVLKQSDLFQHGPAVSQIDYQIKPFINHCNNLGDEDETDLESCQEQDSDETISSYARSDFCGSNEEVDVMVCQHLQPVRNPDVDYSDAFQSYLDDSTHRSSEDDQSALL
ncbi:uncharacterized protein Ecym_4287 [Eremothecium cymbalariae DBVPG|uniref:Subtelomeric hrmA-associated cluster protein AFUB-079030/YDR124W-like helical bundle domain-containing protein n=1 Tax=Eremothecium cymbalariae (strain CBS 270.75 / DBVPG 7215 / KCTC 17166 / NRRL Y-17582) TaxID=931890 RepID=G8JTJ7_ERECY|nr:hypothetical protein Ecym_4287 [Eremothecium cymbalariae DBVPG\